MSRVGKKPITIPSGVTVTINENELEVKGLKGTLKTPIPKGVKFKILTQYVTTNDETRFSGIVDRWEYSGSFTFKTDGVLKKVEVDKAEHSGTFMTDGLLVPERDNDDLKALHGLARALANNAVVGVTEGFTKDLDLVGVGYKAEVQGKKIVFALGYSHPVEYALPDGIDAKAERKPAKTGITQYQLTLTLSGIDKQLLGQVAAELNRLRKPDAYKGKGLRYSDKVYKLKPGKTGK